MNTLFVILGPTGVGKTDLSLRLAQELQTPIISGDSRQIYRGLEIGTAAPAEKELKAVKHYFVGTHDVAEYFNASQFETEVMRILDEEIFSRTPNALLVGGSMMYIDAVCKGIDDIPNVDEEVRTLSQGEYREAPAVFKREGTYGMLSSFCTGWAPNQGKYSLSERMDGRWSLLEDFGDETTFHSQPAFVLEPGDGRYIYVGDRWGGNGEAYFTSTYVILEIRFTEDGRPYIEYTDESAL